MKHENHRRMNRMVRVSEVDDSEAPTVLIVDNNQMTLHRLKQIFHQRDFLVEVCEDGDKAVDEYIRLDPELVILSLDIPSLDGHIAALEMREHGGDCRIVITAPKRLSSIAKDAAFSAGAVACLEKPLTSSSFDVVWNDILGKVPDAPGLADLDSLYPEDKIQEIVVEEDTPELPSLPAPMIAPISLEVPVQTDEKSKSRLIPILIFVAVISASLGWYFLNS
ncbi:MAG: hypothetical protein CMB51_02955 [Euryarchaeota archaeon]|nr:hypothetical protein [Euryarchaeota archaeon]